LKIFFKIKKLARTYPDVFLFLLLLITTIGWVRWLPRYVLQPDPWDEASLLERAIGGFSSFKDFLSGLDQAPLYRFWLHILIFFTKDPLKTYFDNGMILAGLIPLSIFCLCRILGFSRMQSYLSSLLILLFPPLITSGRWTGFLGLIVVLIGSSFAALTREKSEFFFSLALTSFVASLIRPEYQLSFWITLVLGLFFYFLELKTTRNFKRISSILLFLCTVGLFIWQYGNSLDSQTWNRSFYAFREWNILRTYRHLPINEAESVQMFQSLYGSANTVFQSIWSHPLEFLKHTLFSLNSLLNILLSLVFTYKYLIESLFGLSIISVVAITLVIGKKSYKNDSSSKFLKFKALIITIVFCMPVFSGAVIFGSTARHVFPLLLPLICGILLWLRYYSLKGELILGTMLCSIVLLVPADLNQFKYLRPFFSIDQYPRWKQVDEMAKITFIRSLKFKEPIRLVTSRTHIWTYVSVDTKGTDFCWNQYETCPTDPKWSEYSLSHFLKSLDNANTILMNNGMKSMIKDRITPGLLKQELVQLLENPIKYGFIVFPLPCTDDSLYVKKDIVIDKDVSTSFQKIKREMNCD
jgi:hypothetical protein